MIKTCLYCSKEFTPSDSRNKFCDKSCAASYNNSRRKHSEETKRKMSENHKLSRSIKMMNCIICNSEYQHRRYRKTCSDECFNKAKSQLTINYWKNGSYDGVKMGGVRQGSTRGKSGKYQGIYCDSTYELAFVIYNLDHGNSIQRYGKYFDYYDPDRNGHFKFFPDFLVNDQIIEIKNYFRNIDTYKLSGTDGSVIIKYKQDLQEIFEYVEKKTGLRRNRFYELYDNVVIEFKGCANCGTQFKVTADRKKFCSQQCGGQYVGNRARLPKI